ncbi:MATE family efflux transporter [Dechloromonas sp. A34]|uniref:MATE family efflux transporter n=1 Tax=Dechloromonas sp. A34 TaxID=447588 RepID=UPI002248C0C7|nr:MATE family efflux transporter [Dechloromonas sp. A34]
MLLAAARGLLAHAFPILIAQLASIGMMVVDTAVLGHVSPVDLAAVAIGGGIHVSVVFALVGILQAVAPVVAHLHGAKREGEVAGVLQQGFWLALLLSLPGVLFLTHPGRCWEWRKWMWRWRPRFASIWPCSPGACRPRCAIARSMLFAMLWASRGC